MRLVCTDAHVGRRNMSDENYVVNKSKSKPKSKSILTNFSP